MTTHPSSSHVIKALLACGVLYWVLDLSASDRGVVDFIVIGIVSGAIGWNLIQLGRRLHQSGGGTSVWHLLRTLLFWTIGLMNTWLIRPEHVGGTRHWVGWAMVALAVADTVALYRLERRHSPDAHVDAPALPRT